MKKILKCICFMLCITLNLSVVSFAEELQATQVEYAPYDDISNNDIIFTDISPERIEELKASINSEEPQTIQSPRQVILSVMADQMEKAGCTYSGYLLRYSMLSLQEDPLFFSRNSNISSDIWLYSPDFRNIITAFIFEARNKNSYEYFKSTSFTFTAPSIKSTETTELAKRWDLYLALRNVNVELGLQKVGMTWNIIVNIRDLYDFAPDTSNTLIGLGVNFAYNQQEANKIHPFNLWISCSKPNQLSLPYGLPTW